MAVCLAKHGYKVVGIDSDQHVHDQLAKAEAPFYEPNLKEYLAAALKNESLTTTRDYSLSSQSEIAYIAVGTPSRSDGAIDLSYVEQAADMIGESLRHVKHHQLVVIKSTVTPGTARNIVKPRLERQSGKRAGVDFSVCSNPEFLREGNAIHDTEYPDRIIIGSDDSLAIQKLEKVYEEFHGNDFPAVIRTSFENAELTKYANNAFLATKVSFINSIAGIAERIPNADVKSVAAGIGLDSRIGSQFLSAGLGWGGSCLPKDVSALLSFSNKMGYDAELIAATAETNRKQAQKAVQFARQTLGSLAGKCVSVLGLAFKPETDDMRDAVSISVINSLLEAKAKVKVYDPKAMDNAKRIFGNRIEFASDSLKCLEGAECCILVTEWDEFKSLGPESFLQKMRRPIVVDGRRLYDVEKFRTSGMQFVAIGLGPQA